VKARHTKDKSRSYECKSMNKNERNKGMHELCIIIMHVNKLANTKHNKTNVRNTTTTKHNKTNVRNTTTTNKQERTMKKALEIKSK
jgi:hypothetical protein